MHEMKIFLKGSELELLLEYYNIQPLIELVLELLSLSNLL